MCGLVPSFSPSLKVRQPLSAPTSHHVAALLFSSAACCCTASPPVTMLVHCIQALQTRARTVSCTAATLGLDPCTHPRRFSTARCSAQKGCRELPPGGAQRETAHDEQAWMGWARSERSCCIASPSFHPSSAPWSITTPIIRALTALLFHASQAIFGAPMRTCWLLRRS